MAKKLVFDKPLFFTITVLLLLGIVMVYSASVFNVDPTRQSALSNHPFLKQIAAAILGLVAMVVAMQLDFRRLQRPAVLYTIVGGVVGLLILALLSPEVNSTNRWIFVGGVSIQPSELAKIAVVLFVAYHIARKDEEVNEPSMLVPVALGTSFFVVLILLQPDFGTAGIILATAGIMLFLAGLSWRFIALSVVVALPALWFLVISVPYRRARLFSFLEPELDPLGGGYQVVQSMIAVGSGGPWGLGLGQSVQKLHFLPFAESDFIYGVLAEELGLIGAVGVVLLFAVFFWRGMRAGHKVREPFAKYMAWGLCTSIVLQAFINISVAVSLLPTTGTPLPLISYGGSSLVSTLLACGLVLNVSQHGT
ncbi:MAG: putative lipid II flippase FtsW [Acidobacteriota bacterium]|nr:putative lipid II flippase FtsW [Acidobacteriota bacterium]